MIKYTLRCAEEHEFEAWFSNSEAYDKQAEQRLIVCPHCGSSQTEKALMAPSIGMRSNRRAETAPTHAAPAGSGQAAMLPAAAGAQQPAAHGEFTALMRKLREHVEKNADYVGPSFAEEARRIHYEETEARGIYGEASLDEAKELYEEGIPLLPLPRLPEDTN